MWLENVVRYFDLQSENRRVSATGQASKGHLPVLPQYLAVCLGIMIEPYINSYIATGAFNWVWSVAEDRAIFAVLVGILIIPAIYKSSFDAKRPVLIQLAALVPMGMGWQTFFAAATKHIH